MIDKRGSQLDGSALFWANIKHNCRFIKAQRMAEKLCWSHTQKKKNTVYWKVWWTKVFDTTNYEGVVTKLKVWVFRARGHLKIEWVEQVAERRNKQTEEVLLVCWFFRICQITDPTKLEKGVLKAALFSFTRKVDNQPAFTAIRPHLNVE